MDSKFRFWLRYPRGAAAALLLVMLISLFLAGATPFAVNLIPAPLDKLAHAVVFMLVAATIGIAVGLQTHGAILIAAALAIAIGGLDELHQTLLTGRNAGWDDFAADAVGAFSGALLLARLRRHSAKYRAPHWITHHRTLRK